MNDRPDEDRPIWHTDIDEISGELNTQQGQIETAWDLDIRIRMGDYQIARYRSSRGHLGIEVNGPDREKTRQIAQLIFDTHQYD